MPDVAGNQVTINADIVGPTEGCRVEARVLYFTHTGQTQETHTVGTKSGPPGTPLTIPIPPTEVRLWSPESPFLYSIVVRVLKESPVKGGTGKSGTGTSDTSEVLDRVVSYFAMRSIGIAKGPDNQTRIVLNGKPVFLIGPLDQGFWPDGLYTAPTDEALKSDLEVTKKLGFNMIRKHVKVEPARWYYWCDRLGIAVFQDMPSGDLHAHHRPGQQLEINRSAQSAKDYDDELKEMIDARRQFPCIVGWVPFNEGWGQFDTVRVARWIKEYDPSRLVDPASGWNDFPIGDIHDKHDYPGPSAPPANEGRASVLGEFGGLGLPIPGHLWVNDKKNWGYRKFDSRDKLTAAYLNLAAKLKPLVESRLSAAVYTQTTDCETEVNGLMTYDRELIKMDVDKVRAANEALVRLLGQLREQERE